MSLVTRKFNCIVVKIFRFSKFQVEIIFCPPKEKIPLHSHPNIKSTFIHLFGRAVIHRNGKSKILRRFSYFETHGLNFGESHGAINDNSNWFIFLNFERWKIKPTSASEDIKIYD